MIRRDTAIAVIASLLFAGAVSPALAQAPAPASPPAAAPKKDAKQNRAQFEARFKAADKNNDGGLTREEAASFSSITRNFDAIDADKDGKVTLGERDAWAKARRAAQKKQ